MRDEEVIKKLCESANVPPKIYNNERFLFTIIQVNNFFFKGNIGKNDISDGFMDGNRDGGIDFILIDNDILYIIQGKTGSNLTKQDIEDVFTKINSTIEKIETNNYSGSIKTELVQAYLNAKENLTDQSQIKIILFTESIINSETRKNFEKFKRASSLKIKYDMDVYDKDDIEEQLMSLDPNKKVESDYLIIDDNNNVLKYGENGVIVNISANSLKTLYSKKCKKGLFSFNLREKISGSKVDSKIEDTILDEPNEFWYRNNGITIGCEKYRIENNKLFLEGFSIINGAQTTTNIGKSDNVYDERDFYLVCKVIKTPQNLDMEQSKDYLQKISIATNSQKPITAQDIRANDSIQIKLRKDAIANVLPLDIAIKRPLKYENKYLNDWQKIDNIKLGQLIYSCICQNPGLAKTSSSKILDNDDIYMKVYNRKHNYDLYYDMVMLLRKFESYKNNRKKIISNMDDSEKNEEIINQFYICKEGVFTVLAIIFKLLSKTKEVYSNDEIVFKNRLFNTNNIELIDEKIFELFEVIVEEISNIYNDKKIDLSLSNAAYFLKNNTNYENYIVKAFFDLYDKNQMGKILRENLKVFNLD